jgi:plastocyanin
MHLARLGLLACLASTLQAADFTCTLTNSKGGEPVAEAVVSLIPLDTPVPPPGADAQIEIAQEDQEFVAYVTVVQAGTRVVFPNRDTVQHHVYSLSKPKKFELPLYNPGKNESLIFEVPGLVTIGCNIHDWMISHLVVVPTPWFAKTSAQGEVKLAAPPGRYRLEVWHPRMSKLETKELALTEGIATAETLSVSLKSDRRVRRPLGGKTGGYR